jgi:hypothetical protein
LKYRDDINKIFFSIKFNLDNEQIELLQIYFDKKIDDPENENILEDLNLFLSKKNIFQNLNSFRSFINNLFFSIKGA